MEWRFSKYVYGSVVRYTAYSVRRLKGKKGGRLYHLQTPEGLAGLCSPKRIALPPGWEEPLPGTKVLRPLE